ALVETTLPIYELKRSTLLSRRNQPLNYATAPALANSASDQRRIDGLRVTAKRKRSNNFAFLLSHGVNLKRQPAQDAMQIYSACCPRQKVGVPHCLPLAVSFRAESPAKP